MAVHNLATCPSGRAVHTLERPLSAARISARRATAAPTMAAAMPAIASAPTLSPLPMATPRAERRTPVIGRRVAPTGALPLENCSVPDGRGTKTGADFAQALLAWRTARYPMDAAQTTSARFAGAAQTGRGLVTGLFVLTWAARARTADVAFHGGARSAVEPPAGRSADPLPGYGVKNAAHLRQDGAANRRRLRAGAHPARHPQRGSRRRAPGVARQAAPPLASCTAPARLSPG